MIKFYQNREKYPYFELLQVYLFHEVNGPLLVVVSQVSSVEEPVGVEKLFLLTPVSNH